MLPSDGTAFTGKTVTVTLPEGKSVFDIDYFGLWCRQAEADFGHVIIPSMDQLDIPPHVSAAPPEVGDNLTLRGFVVFSHYKPSKSRHIKIPGGKIMVSPPGVELGLPGWNSECPTHQANVCTVPRPAIRCLKVLYMDDVRR